jgi:hypothetical protein
MLNSTFRRLAACRAKPYCVSDIRLDLAQPAGFAAVTRTFRTATSILPTMLGREHHKMP